MSATVFEVGKVYKVGYTRYRVVTGRKSCNDLRLEFETMDGRWLPVVLDETFFIVDFIYQNEDRLYPPPAKGGNYLLGQLHLAAKKGHLAAIDRLHRERGAKQKRIDDDAWFNQDRDQA